MYIWLLDNTYSVSVTLILLCVYFFVQLKIKRAEKKKLKSIKKRDISDAVETESPLYDQEKHLKQLGVAVIEDKFSFFRKAFPVFLIFIWLILVIFPHLTDVPRVYISLIAAMFSVLAGFSFRPFLENLFAGVVISFFKSIKIGDTVRIDDQYGLIEEIGLTYSVLRRWDWSRFVIPNAKLLNKEIENLTMNDQYIWSHVEFFISPDTDIAKVEEISKAAACNSQYFNNIEEPSFWIMELQKDTIKCWLAAWADSPSDAWELRNDIRTQLIKDLQKNGIKLHKYNLA